MGLIEPRFPSNAQPVMGNGASVSPREAGLAPSNAYSSPAAPDPRWLVKALDLVRSDDHDALERHFASRGGCGGAPNGREEGAPSECLPGEDWAALFAGGGSSGALLCLELLLRRASVQANMLLPSSPSSSSPFSSSSSAKRRALASLGGHGCRAAASSLQADALELLAGACGPKALVGRYAADPSTGRLPLHCAAAAALGPAAGSFRSQAATDVATARAVACVAVLVGHGPGALNALCAAGDAPLHVAARAGSAAVCEALLAAGAEPALQNARGQTAAEAAERGAAYAPSARASGGRSGLAQWLGKQESRGAAAGSSSTITITSTSTSTSRLIRSGLGSPTTASRSRCSPLKSESTFLKERARQRDAAAAASSGGGGGGRGSGGSRGRSEAEEMARAMEIWNVFFENAAKRSLAAMYSPGDNAGGRYSSSSFLSSSSSSSPIPRQKRARQQDTGYGGGGGGDSYGVGIEWYGSASARASDRGISEYQRHRRAFLGEDAVSSGGGGDSAGYGEGGRQGSRSSAELKAERKAARKAAREPQEQESAAAAAALGGKWAWELAAEEAAAEQAAAGQQQGVRGSAQPGGGKVALPGPVWVCAHDPGGGGWFWWDAAVASPAPSTWEEPDGWATEPWVETLDPSSGLCYYANVRSGYATWELPAMGGFAAPAAMMAGGGSSGGSGGGLRSQMAALDIWAEGDDDGDGGGGVGGDSNGGWNACLDAESGCWFWYHAASGESAWAEVSTEHDVDEADEAEAEADEAEAEADEAGTDGSGIEEGEGGGWEVHWDEKNYAWYWLHLSTGESRWDGE